VKEPVSVLGVHIAAKVVWLAGVSPEDDLVSDQTDRLSLAGGGMTEERALAELEESIEGVLEFRVWSGWCKRGSVKTLRNEIQSAAPSDRLSDP
jgi:hypothetical protein